ncbi:uncharacterized protein LOC119671414 [Teleopsis dalmanni]|uniref:uncharacterized protein LOC119671414 n=1 Tax=Teleopsis dalmanni TaxID=139649 RepID=UPI0018CDD37F|nr:uncharacterized protein LOC119671414 [Teleopsis dalmanni]
MDENVVLANIAAIITKDILFDDKNYSGVQQKFMQTNFHGKNPSGTKLDEDEEFYLQQTIFNNKNHTQNPTNKCQTNQKKRKMHDFSTSKPKFSRQTLDKNIEIKELNLLNDFESNDFENQLHMSKNTFISIFQMVRVLLAKKFSKRTIPSQTVFSLAMWKLTTDEHFEEISRKFEIPLNTCIEVIRQFWNIIAYNYETFIKWPKTQHAQQTTMNDFKMRPELSQFPKCIFGIITLKRLDIFLETENEEMPIILQIISNAKNEIIDCFVEFAQKYNFDETPIGLALSRKTIPENSFLIGNKYFPLKHYLLRPFEQGCTSKQAAFNSLLEPALNMGTRVLDNIAKRFNVLYALEAKDLVEVRRIVETICSLHNLCIDNEDGYVKKKREANNFNWASSGKAPNVRIGETSFGNKRRADLVETIIGK